MSVAYDRTWFYPPEDRVVAFDQLSENDRDTIRRDFTAALHGEPEPARRYGINLSPMAVHEFATSEGIESRDEARFRLFLQQTEKAVLEFP